MVDPEIEKYLDLSPKDIQTQLIDITSRQFPGPGSRQVKYNAIETLLCYGLFDLVDPHKFGGGNADKLPTEVKELAIFFRRPPNSIPNKMLNLDGSRTNGSRGEVLLYSYLASMPESYYQGLYAEILKTARQIGIGENILPDVLGYLYLTADQRILLGQHELPLSTSELLKGMDQEISSIDQAYNLGPELTEKLAERKVRLKQHRFARDVLINFEYTCAFCGFRPDSLSTKSGLLRASHIKPWAKSDNKERVDVRNGLAACPIHDAAFDQGYLTINGGFKIHKARILQTSITNDQGVASFFGDKLSAQIILPTNAKAPLSDYLNYHRQKIFKG